MKRAVISVIYSSMWLVLLIFGHIVSSQAQSNFTSAPITVNGRVLFDMGVAEVNNDNLLDIFSSNNAAEQSLLLRNQNGTYRESLTQLNLDQDTNFPGLADLAFDPVLTDPGLYIHWRQANIVIRNHDAGSVSGSIELFSPVIIENRRDAQVNVATQQLPSGAVRSTINFTIQNNGAFEVDPNIGAVPVSFDVAPPITANAIYVGPNFIPPSANQFVMQLKDRHGMAFADFTGDLQTDLFIALGGLRGQANTIPIVLEDQLYISNGSQFVEVQNSGLSKRGCPGRQTAWVDYDSDGLLDLYIVCGRGDTRLPNQLYRQSPAGQFTDVANETGLDFTRPGSFVWLDVDQDSRMDLFWADVQTFMLYRNTGAGFVAEDVGENPTRNNTNKLSVADFDNDGDMDIFASAGAGNRVILNEQGNLTTVSPADYGLPLSCRIANWVDYDNDGLMDLHVMPDGLYRNDSGTQFSLTTELEDTGTIRDARASWFDADNNGSRDLLMSYRRGVEDIFSTELLINTLTNHHWLEVKLVGRQGNRPAIGARVILETANSQQVAEVGNAEGSLYSQGHYRLYFGLGNTSEILSLQVHWPDGEEQIISAPDSDQLLTIVQGATSPANQAPILDPIGARSVTEGDQLTIPVSATDNDGPPPLRLSATGIPAGASFTDFGDGLGEFLWTPPSGAANNSPYIVTFRATDGDQAFDTEAVTITVNPATGGGNGSLSGTAAALGATEINLTTEGVLDWQKWRGSGDIDRKAGVVPLISTFTSIGNESPQGSGTRASYVWNDGTPDTTGDASTGTRVFQVGSGFQVSVPADSFARRLQFYVGAKNARGRLMATLSDSSTAAYVTSINQTSGLESYRVTLNYQAASDGQMLTLRYVLEERYRSVTTASQINIEAATLSGESNGGGNTSSAVLESADPGGQPVVTSNTTIDLTAEGTMDWRKWQGSSNSDHKAAVSPQISDFSIIGGETPQGSGTRAIYTWSDGTPTASGTVSSGTRVFQAGNGFQVTVPADNTLRTLKFYIGAKNARGMLTATLSDGSQPAFTTFIDQPSRLGSHLVSLNYRAASANQTLILRYVLDTRYRSVTTASQISIEAAALSQ